MKLAINRCPDHPKYWSVSIDDENGGTRITNGKCCGKWREQKSWPLTRSMCDEAIKLLTQAKEELPEE